MKSLTELTEQDIDAMMAGEKTDEILARALGHDVVYIPLESKYALRLIDKDGVRRVFDIPKYSTDISAAWGIGERMKELGVETEYAKELSETTYRDYKYGENSFLRNIFLIAQASPLQRCKAALKTVRALRLRDA